MSLYFDNASTTYIYREVIDEVDRIMNVLWGNPANLYSFGLEAQRVVENSRRTIAKAIGADPEEILFTSCSSESNAMAIAQRRKCFCSPYEHHDIKENVKTKIMTDEELEALQDYARFWLPYNDSVYAHMLVNNETGEIFDISKQIEQAHNLGMWVLVDCTQALGNIPIDVHSMGIEFASFSFHKTHAPKGIGCLYIKKDIQKEVVPLIFGSQEFGLRGGTSNVPYIVGAEIAVDRTIKELEQKNEHTTNLRKLVIENLRNAEVDFVVNEGENNIPSILNIAFKGITGEALLLMLDEKGISVSTGSACNSGDQKPSEVLSAMGVTDEYIQGAIRISMGLNNTEEDVKYLTDSIVEIIRRL